VSNPPPTLVRSFLFFQSVPLSLLFPILLPYSDTPKLPHLHSGLPENNFESYIAVSDATVYMVRERKQLPGLGFVITIQSEMNLTP